MSYSQYSTSDITGTYYTWSNIGVSSDAVRYQVPNHAGKKIAFNVNTHATPHVWRDDGNDYPLKFAHSSSGPWLDEVSDAATIWLAADAAGNSGVGSFSSPHWQYYSSGPVVQWTHPTYTTSTGRNLQFQFTPASLGVYRVIDTANNNHIHYQSPGSFSANIAQNITFKIHTDVNLNPVFQLYNTTAGANVGQPYTPLSTAYPGPKITASWGVLDTSVTGGKVTLSLPTATTPHTHQENIYYNATDGDEIEVSDSLGNQLWVGRFGVDLPNTSNSIDISPVFQPTQTTAKTLKLRIKNTTYEDSTFHDLVLNSGYGHVSGSYTSPYQAYFPSGVSWSQGGTYNNLVSVVWANNHIGSIISPGIELHEVGGSSNPLLTTMTGNAFTAFTTLTQAGKQYKLRYNGSDVADPNGNTIYTATYTSPTSFTASFANVTTNNDANPSTAQWSFDMVYTNAAGYTIAANKIRAGVQSNIGASYPNTNGNGSQNVNNTQQYGQGITLLNNDVLEIDVNKHDGNGWATYATHTVNVAPPAPTYTASTLSYDQAAGTVTSNITNIANLGSNKIELWVAGNKEDERTTNGPLVYTFSTTPYNTILGPFNFEVKITGGSATQTLTQSHTTGTDPNAGSGGGGGGSGGGTTNTPYLGPLSGGGPKRYPMILTQLFNKKRSFYSIGMTHKDGQLNCFL